MKVGECIQGRTEDGAARATALSAKFWIQPNRIIINTVMRAPGVKIAEVPSFDYCKTLFL
jgi:hypothetical protein